MRLALNTEWAYELVPTTSKEIMAVDSILKQL